MAGDGDMSTKHLVGIYFAATYLLICVVIGILQIGGDGNIILMSLLAFPFSIFSSIVYIYLRTVSPDFIAASISLIMNAIWWYFLGRLFYYVKNKRI
jgi:hypothetical protein